MPTLRPSRYNFYRSGVLFNSLSGALLTLDGQHADVLGRRLMDVRADFEPSADDEFLAVLRRSGFVVPDDADELGVVRERYWRARGETPAVLTITTTIDCNLGCYYCYEERATDALQARDVEGVVALARAQLARGGKRALHVDWYGGEPLLNIAFMEAASYALQAMCAAEGISYVSSIISNGTIWPDDIPAFIARHRVREVQISFDGLEENHNKRRRYRVKEDQARLSSFAKAVGVVDALVTCCQADVRFNIDARNKEDLVPFIRFARERGWFHAKYPAALQPARVSAYSEKSGFMRRVELTLEEYEGLCEVARREMAAIGSGKVMEPTIPEGYPYPRTSVCAALAYDSVVVGAEGKTYRCGLQVGEAGKAVGTVAGDEVGPDAAWWAAFDPTSLPTCSRCSFLPICMSGCAKKHLDCDEHAVKEQGRYWREYLPKIIGRVAGRSDLDGAAFTEAEQFRV